MQTLSAIMLALAAVLAAGLGRALARAAAPKATAAALSGLSLACGAGLALAPGVLQQGLEAKGGLYLADLCVVLGVARLCLALADPSGRATAKRNLYLACLAAGLGLSMHWMSLVVCLPALALLAWPAFRDGRLRAGDLAWGALFAAAGASAYAMALWRPLTVQSLGGPAAWNLAGVWDLAMRKAYGHNSLPLDAGLQAREAARFVFMACAPLLAAAGMAGAAVLWFRKRLYALALGGAAALDLGVVVLANPSDPSTVWVIDPFLLPAVALLAALACAGLAALSCRMPRRLWPVLAALPLVALAPRLDRRAEFDAYDFGRGVLQSLPVGAAYVPEGDFYYMPLAYPLQVEGRRPDLAMQHSNLVFSAPGLAVLAARQPAAARVQAGPLVLRDLAMALPPVPFCVGGFNTRLNPEPWGGHLAWRGLVLQCLPPSAMLPPPNLGVTLAYRPDGLDLERRDPMTGRLARWWAESFRGMAGLCQFSSQALAQNGRLEQVQTVSHSARFMALQAQKAQLQRVP